MGRKVVSPIITMPESSDAALAAAIGRRPQSFSEIIGSGALALLPDEQRDARSERRR